MYIKRSLFQKQCEIFCKALRKELPSSAFFVQPKVSLPPLAPAREHLLLLVCGMAVGWVVGWLSLGPTVFGTYLHAASVLAASLSQQAPDTHHRRRCFLGWSSNPDCALRK